jgi:cobaltochelatase CobS
MSNTEEIIVAPVEDQIVTDGKIVCHIDNQRVHSVQVHISKFHKDTWDLDRYKSEFPDAELMSEDAKRIVLREKKKLSDQQVAVSADPIPGESKSLFANFAAMHEVFSLGNGPAAMSASGNPIQISVLSGHDQQSRDYLPEVDDKYVFNIDLLKKVIIGFELGMPVYLWGMHGTGKTSVIQQAAAHTKRPFMRVQHTLNMQESEVLGQWTVKDGATVFQLGPLPMAMIHGWVYCADEYDFAMPAVSALYQSVLEGEALVIKDAPPQFRRIVPHPQFRLTATGNTNGVGDETGLYQGTLIGNAANYSRFPITEEVMYMDAGIEANILTLKCGVSNADAKVMVSFANGIRGMFAERKISMTVSPRELINACILASAFGGNYQLGIKLAFANRLGRIDKQTVEQYVQRIFKS